LAGGKETKVVSLINNGDLKLPNGRYLKNHKNSFQKYECLPTAPEGQSLKKFLIKMMVFLLQYFICNYQTPLQYTVGKSSSTLRK